MKNTKIISGFPGVGKSYLFDNNMNLTILDSDSSQFSWIKDRDGNNTKERNPNFPENYIQHIKDNVGMVDIIMVSSHKVVRDALKENNIDYILVYPSKPLKLQYLDRYKQRGNDDNFINMIDNNWEGFIYEIENETFPTKLRLWNNEYLGDILRKDYCHIYSEFCTVKETHADEYEYIPCCRCQNMHKLIKTTFSERF